MYTELELSGLIQYLPPNSSQSLGSVFPSISWDNNNTDYINFLSGSTHTLCITVIDFQLIRYSETISPGLQRGGIRGGSSNRLMSVCVTVWILSLPHKAMFRLMLTFKVSRIHWEKLIEFSPPVYVDTAGRMQTVKKEEHTFLWQPIYLTSLNMLPPWLKNHTYKQSLSAVQHIQKNTVLKF